MKAEKGLVGILTADNNVKALLGTVPRVYPGTVPQGTAQPCARYTLVSTHRVRGAFADPGLASATFQIDCFGVDYAAAKNVADTLRIALERKNGSYGGTTVQDVWFESEMDAVDPELKQPYVIAEYRMLFKEA